jgi:hypothetical protein
MTLKSAFKLYKYKIITNFLKSAFKLYKYKIITNFGKLRLIISAHTNYLLKLLKNFPSRTRGRAVYIKSSSFKEVFVL